MNFAPFDLPFKIYTKLGLEHLGKLAKVICGLATTFALFSFARPFFLSFVCFIDLFDTPL